VRRVGEHLATWRRLRGLTQQQVAERAQIGRRTLVALERGSGGTSLETTLRVARILGVMDQVVRALDPYESDVGRLRADGRLPQRIRPRRATPAGRDGP
jgi:transcriptional regulator with XRE-family HTH domain